VPQVEKLSASVTPVVAFSQNTDKVGARNCSSALRPRGTNSRDHSTNEILLKASPKSKVAFQWLDSKISDRFCLRAFALVPSGDLHDQSLRD